MSRWRQGRAETCSHRATRIYDGHMSHDTSANPNDGIFPECRSRQTGRSVAVQESIARLREYGVEGEDNMLEVLLEDARFDVNQAVNLWLDDSGGVVHTSNARSLDEAADDIAPTGVDVAMINSADLASTTLREGIDSLEVCVDHLSSSLLVKSKSKRASYANVDRACIPDDKTPGASSSTYAKKSQKKNNHQRHSSRVSLLGSQGEELPTGVHYDVSRLCTESYDIDVLQMVQTHNESGTIRKIQREKGGVWRFEKKGCSWCRYPPEVSNELEHVFLGLQSRDTKYSSIASMHIESQSTAGSSLTLLDRSLASEHLALEDLSAARELLFSAAETGNPCDVGRLGKLLLSFASQHGMKCDVGFVRRAGLVVGSMRFLQAVLQTTPELCLIGEEVFDKKYPKLSMQNVGRKNCVRCLLARGMSLGSRSCVPPGKLLRKVEADAEPAWIRRWLDSMMLVCPQLPEFVRDRVCRFLAVEY